MTGLAGIRFWGAADWVLDVGAAGLTGTAGVSATGIGGGVCGVGIGFAITTGWTMGCERTAGGEVCSVILDCGT